jgi:hypothetical protein
MILHLFLLIWNFKLAYHVGLDVYTLTNIIPVLFKTIPYPTHGNQSGTAETI